LQDEDVGPLDDSVPVHYYPEGEAAEAASAAVAIGASNKGFQLLQKMGWKGKGLGRKEDGERHSNAASNSHSRSVKKRNIRIVGAGQVRRAIGQHSVAKDCTQ
jgi:hypothetical protein